MRIEDIESEVDPLIINRTKCTKMTDEKNSTIKNGINGASSNNLTSTIHGNHGNNVLTSAGAVYGGNNNNNNNINNNNNNSNGIGIQQQQQQHQHQQQQQHQQQSASTGCIRIKEEQINDNHHRLQDNHKINHKFNNDVVGGSTLINNGSDHSSRSSHHHQSVGGRLQFFKDGKFILELARAREGEKGGWVSVPRKTYWPPSISSANTTTAINYATTTKNESSASLSFSDDNSSIQSSPWQRDHCWKQTTPKKGISKEMCMMFKRMKNFKVSHDGYKLGKIKRRRPYDISICKIPFTYVENGFISNRFSEDLVDGIKMKEENKKEENDNNCSSTEHGIVDCRNKKTVNADKRCNKSKSQLKLTTILQKLIDRLPTGVFSLPKTTHGSGAINHFSSTSSRIADYHHHHQHVSPRKRILRELEKVTLEDNKRSRAKAGNVTSLSPLITTSNSVCHNVNKVSNASSQISSTNESSNDQHTTPTSNSTRLYSSYSIHSLLGHTNSNHSNHSNHKTESSAVNNSPKELNNDPLCLRNIHSSPKSPESYSQGDVVTSSSHVNNKKKSPTYSSLHDVHRHNRSPSSEMLVNYGRVRSPEINRSPDNNLSSRYKQFGSPVTPSTTSSSSSGFHPYLASPKYSSNNQSPNLSTDNYKLKAICTSNSPNHIKNTGCSRSPSAFSPSPQNKISSFHSPTSTNNGNRLREPSPSETASPGLERREAIPRTVPKKTVALRQQFSSPVSSPSVVTQGDSTSSTYKSGIDQKRKNFEERTLSPENAIYHSGVDMEHVTAGVLRSSPVLPHSSLFYLYPPHGSPGSHSASSYIPPVSYYHPYAAAAVAALRNPLWMHYQAGVMSSVGIQPRLPTSIFPYNGTAGSVSAAAAAAASSIPSSLASMHLSPAAVNPWSPLNRESSVTEDPVSLVSIKDEHSSDVPLNLSKH